MKKFIPLIIVVILIFSGLSVSEKTNLRKFENKIITVDDASAIKCLNLLYPNSNKLSQQKYNIQDINLWDDYPLGETIWKYTISTGYDNSPKAIAPIEDINNDGIDDVIICSEDDYVRCFDGAAIDTGVVLWSHEIYAGDIYSQKGLDVIEDVDGDDYQDVVVGAAWGARLIRCISGESGQTIWTHDTHEYGGGGWVYQVDCSYDYNNDGTTDVLAATGDDSSDTGPKRIYCLNGLNGDSIWENPLGGPGFAVIGVEDFTGDGHPDVLAGCSNEAETQGYAKGINGDTGSQVWTHTVPGSSVWAVEQIDDVSEDGIKDVIIGDFAGNIYGLDATDGGQEYSNSVAPAIITRFAKLTDVNTDGHPDIVPAHSTTSITQAIDGQTGETIWTHSVVDQPWNVARISDVNGDGIDDVLVGTLFNSNYCYFLDGVDGSELEVVYYGQAVDAINSIPDVVEDGSMEMVAGGRDGKVTCISGGLDALVNDPPIQPIIDGPITGAEELTYEFSFISTDPDEDNIYYFIDWDDNSYEEWIGPYTSGEKVFVTHSWSSADNYTIVTKSKDEHEAESEWSDPFTIIIVENEPPETPEIKGPLSGKPKVEYAFTFATTDVNGDKIFYYIEWNDGTIDKWIGPYSSGENAVINHTWKEKGNYTIKAKAKDIYNEESDWAYLEITMPFKKFFKNRLFTLLNDFFPLIKWLLNLFLL